MSAPAPLAAVEPLRVFLVDDEAPARARLRDLLADVAGEQPNLVCGEAPDGLAALQALPALAADLVLVDIRMPRMDGIELARHLTRLPQAPAVIFVTAYDAYAVQAFELNAIDYLLKPVRAPRLATALARARLARPPAPEVLATLPQGARSHLSCHERGRLLLVPLDDIVYLRADLKYVVARTCAREFLLDESLTHLEQEFGERFLRLHRSVLVARAAIAGFERSSGDEAEGQWHALLRGVSERLPVSRRQWPLLRDFARQLSG